MTTPRFHHNLRLRAFNDSVVEALSPYGCWRRTTRPRACARRAEPPPADSGGDSGRQRPVRNDRKGQCSFFRRTRSALFRHLRNRSSGARCIGDVPSDLRAAFVALSNNVRQHIQGNGAGSRDAQRRARSDAPDRCRGHHGRHLARPEHIEPVYTGRCAGGLSIATTEAVRGEQSARSKRFPAPWRGYPICRRVRDVVRQHCA